MRGGPGSILPMIVAVSAGVGISMYTLQPAFIEQQQHRLAKETKKQVDEVEHKAIKAQK